MKLTLRHYFLAALALAVAAPLAAAQAPALPAVSPSCAGGKCRPVQAAVTQVRTAGANAVRAVAGRVAPPVRGVYADGTVCACPPVHVVPQRMPVRQLHRLHLLLRTVTGR